MTIQNEGKRPKKSRFLAQILLFLVLLWVGFMAVSWVLGRQAVERYCTGLAPGATIEQARDRARAEGLRFPSRDMAPPAGEGRLCDQHRCHGPLRLRGEARRQKRDGGGAAVCGLRIGIAKKQKEA